MSEGCTSCQRKGGCSHRKAAMFEAIEQALARLYPSSRWQERPEGRAEGVGTERGAELAAALGRRLAAQTVYVPGNGPGACAYLYVLCTGRPPSLIELREGHHPPGPIEDLSAGRGAVEELYLRVALSGLAPFAAVQQVTLRGETVDDLLLVEEAPRAGVFDPILLSRFARLVATLPELGIRHLDCGEIVDGPAGFDPGDYPDRYRQLPGIINYLFFPQPATTLVSTVLRRPIARHFAIDAEPVSSNLDLIGG
jgi:hypothetical protein